MFSFAEFGNDLYTGRRSFDIVGKRRLWYAIAAVVVALSALLLLTRGLNGGIEFRGGSEFQVQTTAERASVDRAEEILAEEGIADPRVQMLGEDTVRVQVQELSPERTAEVQNALAEGFGVDTEAVSASFVGPTWGEDVSQAALRALVIFLALVVVYLSITFEWKMALAALVALLHDVVITAGIYALVGFEVSPATVIGLLTILGYSLYDTVVVFDKVRENTAGVTAGSRYTYSEAANVAVNQTLVRSVNTSVIALLPIGAILFVGAGLLGAGTLKDLALALFIGVAVGTFSSIFIATPLLADLKEREPQMQALATRVAQRRAGEAAGTSGRRTAGAGEGGATAVEGASGATALGTAVLERAGTRTRGPRATGGPRPQPRRRAREDRRGKGR